MQKIASLRTTIATALFLILASTAWVYENKIAHAPYRREVKVGLYENSPKIYTNQNGKPAGLFIELLDEIARIEGWHLTYISCKWNDCLEQLKVGSLDLMPDVAFSPERNQIFDFHEVSVASSWSQIYRSPNVKIHTLADLNGKRVALLKGGIQQSFFSDLMRNANYNYQPVEVSSLDQGYQAVIDGHADVVITNSFFAGRAIHKYNLNETPITFLPSNLYFASTKNRNADLLSFIDTNLKNWRQNSDSIYFEALHRAMAMPPDIIVPSWVAWTVTALAIFILMLLSLNVLLRWRVNQRTHALHQITQELIDQRAHLEDLINERNAELQALFNSASVGIVHLKNRIIVRCNHRINELFGYDADELVGKPTKIWYANEADWSLMGNSAYESIWQNKDFIREQMMIRKDGSFFWVKLSGRAIDIADSSKGIVIVIEDMTSEHNAIEEMRKAKNVAEEATRMKSEFLANMSHEIRTPMNAILGMLYLALKNDLTPNLQNYLSKAQIAARSLLSIINDILDFSKIEAGKMQIESTQFSLNTVLEQVTDTIGYQAEKKGIEFLIRYDVTVPSMLVGDPLRLGQILLNLCGNAVKFTEKGEVELAFHCESVTETDLVLHVCVHDSGIGMSLEHQSKLFMKFTQADQSITRHYGGTGLGLAICKNLVSLMNGDIWIEKSALGYGTTICFSVPFKIAKEAQIHRRKLLEQAGPQLEGLRALIVDDNALSREILTEMLLLFRIDVSTAENGYSALKILERATDKPFDVVLMDWKMPGMTGDEVTQRIHSNRFIQHHPKIILITSYGREDVIRIAEQVGVDGFIIKPISPSTLLNTVLSVLGQTTSQTILENNTADICLQSNNISYHGVRILLVEDNEINREFAKTLLESHGIEVDEVWNGEEALLQVQNQHYDAVLMDIQMPIMDGLEATQRIRKLASQPAGERFAELPIIAMTALAMVQDTEKSRTAGMNDHIAKPIDPEQLIATLSKWVGKPESHASLASEKLTDSLPELQSIDIQQGLRRIGGKKEAYRKQLIRFRNNYANSAIELTQLINQSQRDEAEKFTHSLKGVAGNIGATYLYEIITDINTHLSHDTSPDASLLTALSIQLDQVILDIDRITNASTSIEQQKPPIPLNQTEIMDKLRRLPYALKYDLGMAETLLAELVSGITNNKARLILNDITAKVDIFAIDEALGLLQILTAHLTALFATEQK